jgi:hypothetical protein
MDFSRRNFVVSAGFGAAALASQAPAQRTDEQARFMPGDVKHTHVKANGISLHIAEQGTGRWYFCVTDFPKVGIAGGTSFPR